MIGEWPEEARACFEGCGEEQDVAGKPGLRGLRPGRNSLPGNTDGLRPQNMLPLLKASTLCFRAEKGRVRAEEAKILCLPGVVAGGSALS